MLCRVRRVMDQKTRASLYKSLVLPLCDYCDITYDGLRQSDSSTLQKLQNAAARIILKSESRTHIGTLHKDLNLEMLDARRKRHIAYDIYKVYRNLSPQSILKMFDLPISVHQRPTRYAESGNFVVPLTRLELTKKSFRLRRIRKEVPGRLKVLLDMQTFKEALYNARIFE